MKNIIFITAGMMPLFVYAGTPLCTFTPQTATTVSVPANGSAIVQYNVQNQSSRSHTLVMEAVTGISQITTAGNCASSFTLAGKQSCLLTLQITGSQISGNMHGGPKVCQQAPNGKPDPLLCYQPGADSILNITLLPANVFYSGTQNGNVYYSGNGGVTWTVTAAKPSGNNAVNSIFAIANTLYAGDADGFVYYSTNNGNNWNATTQPDGSAVNSVFATTNTLYAGTANGSVYYSTNNGSSWTNTTQPDGSAVNGMFVTASALYAGTANGRVYYSINNGATWAAINGQPDGSAVKSIFVASNKLYVNTANEYVYTSTSLSGGGNWTTQAQTVFSLFVNPAGTLYAGTQNGFVFSVMDGTQLGFVTNSSINSIYLFQPT